MNMRLEKHPSGRQSLDITIGESAAPVTVDTLVEGFTVIGVEIVETIGGGAIRHSKLADLKGNRHVEIIERFRRTGKGIHWETELRTDCVTPFTAPVISEIRGEAAQWPEYWTAWADPRQDGPDNAGDPWAVANAELDAVKNTLFSWQDPLAAKPAENRRFWYGAPYFEESNPRIGFSPFMNNLICIPMVTAMHGIEDIGLTFALSPEDPILDVMLDASEDGTYRFTRLFYRFDAARPLLFSADLFAHEKDWRGSLRCMTDKYPHYFYPEMTVAHDIAGTGAYSTNEVEFDEVKLRRMGFKVNWKASFDFPYMGMFLPDVPDEEEWQSYGNYPQSISQMRRYSADMRSRGFHVLSYFNVTEFGADVQFPLPALQTPEQADMKSLWEDCSLFLKRELEDALLLNREGQPYTTWGNAVAMDPGEPAFQRFLLDQARRHIDRIPDSCGLCVDRLDWTRLYNDRADDGVSWFDGKPCRSLQLSWQSLMEPLSDLLHRHGKVLYCNNHTKRLEQLLHVDGMLDEFTYAATALNTSAMLGVFKPVMGWVAHEGQVLLDYHSFFQRFLYMGVFPMAPFPGNDHSLRPSPEVDEAYLAYGPLLERLRGKQWLLSRNPVSVEGHAALANIFEVPNGYVIPVVFAKEAEIRLVLRLPKLAMGDVEARCEALHPGSDRTFPIEVKRKEDVLELVVPVHNRCAMVLVQLQWNPQSAAIEHERTQFEA